MITEKVYSPIEDKKIRKNIVNSPIWKKCYKEEEITKEIREKHNVLHVYTIKFNGLIPTQVTRIKTI